MSVTESNINRLLAALNHEKADRVPNFEILLDARCVSHILGCETDQTLWSLPPQQAVNLVRQVGQDAVACSLSWPAVEEGTVLTHEDVDKIAIPDPHDMRPKLQAYLDAAAGTSVGVCARLSGPLTATYMATGPIPIQSFMLLLYDNPSLCERLMDMFTDYHVALIEAIADLPYHFYYIGDDVSSNDGPLISPKHIAELWAPRTERIVKAALGTGRPVMFHCCGKQEPILPYLVKWGVNATHPIQPGANDINEIHEKYGDKLTLVGNIHVGNILTDGDEQITRQAVRDHIDKFAGEGGLIMCSSHSIVDSVQPHNYLAMVDETQKYGVYG